MHGVSSHFRRLGSRLLHRGSFVRSASLLLCLALLSACRATTGAKTVATRLAATAASLSSYYTALHAELAATDQLNDLNQAVSGLPYAPSDRARILDSEAEIQKRIELANDLSTLAASLTQLTTSTGAADACAAAGKFASAVTSITPLSSTVSTSVQSGIATAAQDFVTAVQNHKTREAARRIAGLLENFNKLFTGEQAAYATLNDQYVDLAALMSGWFVQNGQADPAAYSAALAKMALAPFGLTAKIDAATVTKIASTEQMFIDQKAADMKAAQIETAQAMQAALTALSESAADVAANKPLPGGIAPPSLDIVNRWAAAIVPK